MRERVLATDVASYEEAELTDYTAHGFKPVSDQIVVWRDVSARTAGKKGLIHLPDQAIETMNLATQSGILVAKGEGAFVWTSDRMREYVGFKPEIGDRVIFPRYAGKIHMGNDGRNYLFMDDKAVLSVMEKNNG